MQIRIGRRAAVYAFLVLAAILISRPGLALVGDTEKAFGLDGSFRLIGLGFNYPAGLEGADSTWQGILRLTAAGHPTDRTSYEVHLVQSVTHTSGSAGTDKGFFDGKAVNLRYRAWDDTWTSRPDDHTTSSLGLDRFCLKIALDRADITVGRQAVTFGKAYFWNPLDVFLPFDPSQFDRDYKPGVDAVRLDVPLGNFSGFTLIGVLGREVGSDGVYVDDGGAWDASWAGSAVLARVFTNYNGWDLVAQGGKIHGGYQVGGGLVGEIKGVGIRAEAAWFLADDDSAADDRRIGDHLTAVAGLGYRFENSLELEFECLYNGGGETGDLDRVLTFYQNGDILHLGRWLWGLTVSYEITPLIVGRLAAINSLTDGSTRIQPSLVWSLSDNSELVLGAAVNFGQGPRTNGDDAGIATEFGAQPDYLFGEYKIYF